MAGMTNAEAAMFEAPWWLAGPDALPWWRWAELGLAYVLAVLVVTRLVWRATRRVQLGFSAALSAGLIAILLAPVWYR